MTRTKVYHIPVCPFSQRLEILLALKDRSNAVDFVMIDITQPRPDWLLQKTAGVTSLPILETADGRIIRESLVILQYLEELYPEPAVAQGDPDRRAIETMITGLEGAFGAAGYRFVMNRNPEQRNGLRQEFLEQLARVNAVLKEQASAGPFLFQEFGWAETIFTPFFMRFCFLDYYEDFQIPGEDQYARVRDWWEACIAHPAAQQVTSEQIIKLYYDYALGVGNGALPPGRRRSSFALEPDWRTRPWPPRNKYDHLASDAELGL